MACNCNGTPTVNTPPVCPSGNCLKMSDVIVACKDAVGPCGAVGSVNFVTPPEGVNYCHNTTACGVGTITYSLKDWDKNIFETVSVSGSVATWTTKDKSTINKFGWIKIRACCGEYSSIFKIHVCVKDLCRCTVCTVNQDCDPCNGNCVPKSIDVGVGDFSNNIDVSIV